MKKSRIIFPALAMLTLSVAASVTGTVAWFTASRTANMNMSNLAAFSTAGDLTLKLKKGNTATEGATDVDGFLKTDTNIKLQYMTNASFDIARTESGKSNIYYAQLDNDGMNVTETKAVKNDSTFKMGTLNNTDIYYVNQFEGKFETSSVNETYLFFNNNLSRSAVIESIGGDNISVVTAADGVQGKNEIYRALRVGIEASTAYTKPNEGNTALEEGTPEVKKIVWAPYATETETDILNVCGEGVLDKPYRADNVDLKVDAYKSGGTSLIKKTHDGSTVNVVKSATADPILNTDTKTKAGESTCLLSTKIRGAYTEKPGGTVLSHEAAITTVKFTIWFEGLSPNCLSTTTGVNEIKNVTAAASKAIKLGFYAIDTTTLGTGA